MGKRYEAITINGEDFKLDKLTAGFKHTGKEGDIYSAYGRPSPIKCSTFRSWDNWFKDNNGSCGVHSKNCFRYTILGYVQDANTGKWYEIYITPSYQYAFAVD